jgi:hypothetical protein
MKKRRNQFTVGAESVQGNANSSVTFKGLKIKVYRAYVQDPKQDDESLLLDHIVSWNNIYGDDDKPLPSPADDPQSLGELYMYEKTALIRLLIQGPIEDTLKN